MAGEDQTPKTAPAVASLGAPGNHTQEDFESAIRSYVAETNEDQVSRIKKFMAETLQAECDRHDKAIKAAWETIDKAMKTFSANRDKLIEIMSREEGLRRTQKAVELGGLDKMAPPTYKKLVGEITLRHKESNPTSQVSLEAHSPGLSATNDAITSSTSPAVVTTAPAPTTAPPVVKYTAKRSRPDLDQSTGQTPKRARADVVGPSSGGPATATLQPSHFGAMVTRNADIPGFIVEGKEYIFPYPEGSKFFYVLRCDGDKSIPAHTFKTNPFRGQGTRQAPAMEHYCRVKRCKGGHDGERIYTREEIVRYWGHRVTGVDVKEAWVDAANKRLEESETKKESALSHLPAKPSSSNQLLRY